MSEKKNVNTKRRGKYQKKSERKIGWVIILLAVALLVGCLVMYLSNDSMEQNHADMPTISQNTDEMDAAEQTETEPEEDDGHTVNLGYGIYVTDVGPYNGIFMEDGSDELLSDILMIIVKNNGDRDIQLAEISMDIGEQQAQFSLTSLPVGRKMVLLEKNRMSWDETVDYDAMYPMVDNIAYFQEPVSRQEDRFQIDILDGMLNITNISGKDITGNIVVYYKNAEDDLYYGGITYRVTLEGGLKDKEIRQVLTNHASESGTEIVFVTVAE